MADDVAVLAGDETCYGVDPVDGERRWQYDLGRGTLSRAAVGSDGLSTPTAFFHAISDSGVRSLTALDATNGQQRWRVTDAVAYNNAPAYRDGTVYVSGPDGTEARRASDGERLWSVDVGHLDFRRGVPAPTVTDGAVVLPEGGEADVGGYDPTNGNRLWRVSFPYTVTRPVSVVEDALVVQSHTDEAVDTAVHAYTW